MMTTSRPMALIVDDEEPIRNMVDRILRHAGFSTRRAVDGIDALSVAATIERIDLLVTDLMMPNMNGSELARQLRTREPDLPVLYLTGHSDRLFDERQLTWQSEAYLDKPCSMKGLLEAVSLVATGHTSLDWQEPEPDRPLRVVPIGL